MKDSRCRIFPVLLLTFLLFLWLPGQAGAEEIQTRNLPIDHGDAPEAKIVSYEIIERIGEESLRKEGTLPSEWRCELPTTANIWFKGSRIVIPFTLKAYGTNSGEYDETMYVYLFDEAGDVVCYFEEDFSRDSETASIMLEMQGSENLEAGTYYLIYYATKFAGNRYGTEIPIYIEEYDPNRQYSYVELPPDVVGKRFNCGELEEIRFTVNSLGYVGHEYFFELYDSEYHLIQSVHRGFDYGVYSEKGEIAMADLNGDLRPGTYYLRAYSSFHTKNKDRYFPFYVDQKGSGYEFDEESGTLTFFGQGKTQKWVSGVDYGSVKHIVLEPGYSAVSESAFMQFKSLETVTLPAGIVKIEKNAFGTSGLQSINLPEGLVSIGQNAFSNTKIESIAIPNSVTNIDMFAFEGCDQLKTVTAFGHRATPCQAVMLRSDVFARCSKLTRLEIPSSVTQLNYPADNLVQNPLGCGPSLKEIVFKDEAPVFICENFFEGITATVYYPSDLDSWTEEIMQDYGGNLTWEPYDRQLEDVVLTEAVGHKTGNIIRWNAARHADLYQVYRRAADETSWTLLKNTRSLAYKDESAAVGVRYYYKVRARKGNLMSSLDIPALSAVRAYPLDSVNMTKILGHKTGNIVYWEAVDGADLYQVFRRAESESGWTLIKNTRSLAYKDESAALGVKYYYKVRARNGDLMSSMDITALSAVRPYPLASVKMTKAVGHATGNIIYWEAVENAKLYQVYRRTADESGWTLIKNTGSLAYKDTEAQSGVKYYYKVVARNGDDRSSMDIPAVSATRP